MATNKPIVPRPTRIGRPHPSATHPDGGPSPAAAGRLHPPRRGQGDRPDPARVRPRSRSDHSEAGLDPRLFEDGSNDPALALGRLCSLSGARTASHFGLLVGERATILSLGGLPLMLHSKTVGEALRGLVAHLGVQNRAPCRRSP